MLNSATFEEREQIAQKGWKARFVTPQGA